MVYTLLVINTLHIAFLFTNTRL